MKDGKVGYGIIGIGGMGSYHVKYISELKNAEVVAAYDIDPNAYNRIDEGLRKKIACYDSADKFFSDPNVDIVLIVVPHYDHPDLAIEAMKHGKHIIVEKPIAVHKKEAERLLAEAAKYPNLVKSAMFCMRTVPAHRKLKQLIDSGEIGAIRRVNWIITDWFRTQAYYDSGTWRATWSGEGGGVLLNQCPHQLDMMQWFFGMPSKVMAFAKIGKYHDIEVEDEINAYLEYEDGKTANFVTTTGEAPGTNRLEIAADRGRVIMEGGKINFLRNEVPVSEWIKTDKDGFERPPVWKCEIPIDVDNRPMHQIVSENVANAVLKGEKLIAPLEEGIKGLELGNAMLLSGLTGKIVNLPMDSEEYARLLAGLVANSRKKSTRKIELDASNFTNSFGAK